MQGISGAELILNEDGSIYHINLCPGELAPTIITVGDPGRVARVSDRFDEVNARKSKREFICHTGRVGRTPVSVISTGIGPDNIDIVLNEADALFNIDFETRAPKEELSTLRFIRIGTSGALRPDIAVDSLVASAYGLGLDNLMGFYHYPNNLGEAELTDQLNAFMKDTIELPFYACSGSAGLLEKVGKGMQHGITLTAPGFYAPQGRQLRLKPRFRTPEIEQLGHFAFRGMHLANFEMETAAIYGLARLLGHEALSTNAILANRPAGTFSRNPAKAVDRLIEEVLSQLG